MAQSVSCMDATTYSVPTLLINSIHPQRTSTVQHVTNRLSFISSEYFINPDDVRFEWIRNIWSKKWGICSFSLLLYYIASFNVLIVCSCSSCFRLPSFVPFKSAMPFYTIVWFQLCGNNFRKTAFLFQCDNNSLIHKASSIKTDDFPSLLWKNLTCLYRALTSITSNTSEMNWNTVLRTRMYHLITLLMHLRHNGSKSLQPGSKCFMESLKAEGSYSGGLIHMVLESDHGHIWV